MMQLAHTSQTQREPDKEGLVTVSHLPWLEVYAPQLCGSFYGYTGARTNNLLGLGQAP